MKKKNKWEELFEQYMDLTEFTLIKYSDGWGIYDIQGGNLGDIESDRFENAADIFDRMNVYIEDYFFEDLERELDAYNVDLDGREIPCGGDAWLELKNDNEFYSKNKKYFDEHAWEFDVLDMIANHANEIDLENVYYKSEVSPTFKYSDEDMLNIISSAIYDIGYWGRIDGEQNEWYEARHELQKDYTFEDLMYHILKKGGRVIIFDTEDEDEEWDLTLDGLLKGIKLAIENGYWDGNIDTIDGEVGDIIFQYALFNEIVFG